MFVVSPDLMFHSLFKYINRRTFINVVFYNNSILQFGTNTCHCILSGVGFIVQSRLVITRWSGSTMSDRVVSEAR